MRAHLGNSVGGAAARSSSRVGVRQPCRPMNALAAPIRFTAPIIAAAASEVPAEDVVVGLQQHQQQQQPEQQQQQSEPVQHQQQQLEPVQQQQQLEPEQTLRLDQGQQYTRQRVRKLARSWEDSSSANTGLVSLTEKSQVAGAAACVAADLETNVLTRIVPCAESLTQRAIHTLRLATKMVNQNLVTVAEDRGKAHAPQTLAFQPVEVNRDLAAPPALPEGAVVLYTTCVAAGNSILQEALKQRAAAAAAAADSGSRSSSVFTVSSKSEFAKVAAGMSNVLSQQGWVELMCVGRQDFALPIAIQTLVKLRRQRYGRHKDDVTAVLLGDEDVLGPNASSHAPAQEGLTPPTSFLVLRCRKNYSTKLLPLQQS